MRGRKEILKHVLKYKTVDRIFIINEFQFFFNMIYFCLLSSNLIHTFNLLAINWINTCYITEWNEGSHVILPALAEHDYCVTRTFYVFRGRHALPKYSLIIRKLGTIYITDFLGFPIWITLDCIKFKFADPYIYPGSPLAWHIPYFTFKGKVLDLDLRLQSFSLNLSVLLDIFYFLNNCSKFYLRN